MGPLRAKAVSPSATLSPLRPQRAPSCLFHVNTLAFGARQGSAVCQRCHTRTRWTAGLQHLLHARGMFPEKREGQLQLQKKSVK